MTVNFDPAADFVGTTDGLEAVTLSRRGTAAGTTVAHALRRAVTVREATLRNRYHTRKKVPSGGGCTAGDVTWHLPVEELGGAPELGDVVVDGTGDRWTILEVQLATLQTRWRCMARNLVVAHALDDTIVVLKATYAKGVGGAAEPTWRVWKTGVRARIQPAETDVVTELAARQTVGRYQIFIAEDLALDHTHRIQGPDGTLYRVNGSNGAERIGEVQTIDADVTAWTSP